MYAWERVLIPMAKAFKPDLIIVSCGFDSARGDPLGGFDLTPKCYGHMTRILQNLCKGGKVVLALEGGYNLKSISLSGAMCVRALLGEQLDGLEINGLVDNQSFKIIEDCHSVHSQYLLKKMDGDDDVNVSYYPLKTEIPVENDMVKKDEISKTKEENEVGNSSTVREVSNEAEAGAKEDNNNNNKGNVTTVQDVDGQEGNVVANENIMDLQNNNKPSLPHDDDGGFNPLGYQIIPSSKCKHALTAHQNPTRGVSLNDILKCSVDSCEFNSIKVEPQEVTNIWFCVTCLKSFCGRCCNAHGITHAQTTNHTVLIGFDDLSCWCYGESDNCPGGCDSYVDPFAIEKLRPVFSWLHHLKFGSDPTFPSINSTTSNSNDIDDEISQAFSLTLEILGDDDSTLENNTGNDIEVGVIESKK
eukprot:g7678.t1